MPQNEKQIRPEEGVKVWFLAASAFAKKIEKKKKLVALTGSHRGQVAIMDEGYLIIDQQWYAK